MKPSENCYKLLRQFEGCRLKAYLDSASIPTIGFGCTYYPDGSKVKLGDSITEEKADFLLKWQVLEKARQVDAIIVAINQNQFDALVSFAYNLGVGALKKSTLLKKVLANPNDPSIADEFRKWNKAGGVVLKGLQRRREAELALYFNQP